MHRKPVLFGALGILAGVGLAAGAVGADGGRPEPTVFAAAGPDNASIQSNVDGYRNALGALNTGPGSKGSGRRQIGWDGVPEAASSPNPFPGDFFNTVVPNGLVTTSSTDEFEVSANEGAGFEFGNLNPDYPDTFSAFSPRKLFTGIRAQRTDVHFFEPGGDEPAGSSGFGVVFTDVDRQGSATVEFFDAHGKRLYKAAAPASPGDASVSFVGVKFDCSNCVANVRIRSGDEQVGKDDAPGDDVVVMDDFIYGEPIPF
ncbi:MAG: hypothetical protein ACKVWR_14820 [Acidimicrobiales bacterium]